MLLAAGDANSVTAAPKLGQLRGQVGITTSSLSGHLVARPAAGKLTLLDLPKFMRDELDMK